MGRIMVIGLLLVQPFLSLPVWASNAVPGAVVVNEFSTQPGWVELYNTTDAAIDLTNWQLQTAAQAQVINGTIPALGFVVLDMTLDSQKETLQLKDDTGVMISGVAYGEGAPLLSPPALESTARRVDGGLVWAVGAPTKGFSNKTDFLPPSVPTEGSPNGIVKTTHDFAFSWGASTDNDGPVRYEFRMATQPDQLASGFITSIEGTSVDFKINSDAADGEWYWQVRAVDQSQNYSAWSDVWQVRVDTNGPGMTIEKPELSVLYGGPQTKEVTFEATIIGSPDDAPVVLELDGADVTSQTAFLRDEQANLHVSGTFSVDTLTDGDHAFLLRAADDVGNIGEQVRVFTIDTTPPELVANITEGEVFVGKVRLTLTAEEAHPGEYSLTVERSGEVISLKATDQNDTERTASLAYSYVWDTTAVRDGLYTLRFHGTDTAGNTALLVRTVKVDNMPGNGSLVTAQPPTADPLLDRLSKQLTQPFPLPKPFDLEPVETANISDHVSDLAAQATPTLPITDQNAKLIPAVSPTEEGWRVFGVLWHWWFLLVLTVIVTWRRYRKMIQPVNDSAV